LPRGNGSGAGNIMGNKNKKPTAVRRVATSLAVLGALVMSSGVALMVTAASANATTTTTTTLKDWVCKYVGQPGHEVLKQGNDGLVWVATDQPQGTFFVDNQQLSYLLVADVPQDPKPDASNCPPAPGDEEPPTCPAGTDHAGDEIPVGQTAESFCDDADAPVCAVGTDNAGQTIPGGQTAEEFCDDADAPVCAVGTDNAGQTIPEGQTAEEFCTDTVVVVSPPGGTTVVSPPKAKTPKAHTPKAAVSTPTVVHAGLAGVSAQDLRGEQGLALMVAGMFMLVAAGGLGLRLRGVASRI
jgi:hypothetical protein